MEIFTSQLKIFHYTISKQLTFYHIEFSSFDTLNSSARPYASYPASFSSPLLQAEGSFREPSHALRRLLQATWRQSRGCPWGES